MLVVQVVVRLVKPVIIVQEVQIEQHVLLENIQVLLERVHVQRVQPERIIVELEILVVRHVLRDIIVQEVLI